MLQLLQQLHAHACSGQPQPKLPVQSHDKRLPSSKRGLSLAAIRALRRFFAAHGMLDRPLSEVIDRSGTWEGTSGYAGKGADGIGASFSGVSGPGASSLSALTRRYGLSLVESLVLLAGELEPEMHPVGGASRACLALSGGSIIATRTARSARVEGLVGPATTFVSYRGQSGAPALVSREQQASQQQAPIRLGDLLLAIEQLGAELEKKREELDDEEPRYYWIDLFSLSQPLCCGHYHPGHCEPNSPAHAARVEEVAKSVELAVGAAVEAFVFRLQQPAPSHDEPPPNPQQTYQAQQQQQWQRRQEASLAVAYGPMTTRRQISKAVTERRMLLLRSMAAAGSGSGGRGRCAVREFRTGSEDAQRRLHALAQML